MFEIYISDSVKYLVSAADIKYVNAYIDKGDLYSYCIDIYLISDKGVISFEFVENESKYNKVYNQIYKKWYEYKKMK